MRRSPGPAATTACRRRLFFLVLVSGGIRRRVVRPPPPVARRVRRLRFFCLARRPRDAGILLSHRPTDRVLVDR